MTPSLPEVDPPLLDCSAVSVRRGERLALDRLTLRIQLGEHVAILGPNGCGKSTLLKTITRECYPLAIDGTQFKILGREQWNVWELRASFGIVSYDLASALTGQYTGLEAVLSGFFSSVGTWPHQTVTDEMRVRAAASLDVLEAGYLKERCTAEMSSGEMRRVLLARALVHEPRALLLDEPSTALDLLAQQELRDVLRNLARQGRGLILITHHLSDIVPEIERVVMLKAGRIVADGPKEEVLTAERLAGLFGLPVSLEQREGYYHCW